VKRIVAFGWAILFDLLPHKAGNARVRILLHTVQHCDRTAFVVPNSRFYLRDV
jgi:hypothetical protein